MNNYYKENKAHENYLSEITRYCKCGHSVQFKSKSPYILCSFCGKIIFRNKKCEYDYKIKRRFLT